LLTLALSFTAALLAPLLLACDAPDAYEQPGAALAVRPAPCEDGGDGCLRARVDCAWGSRDCNPAVDNVIAAVQALPTRGAPMGVHRGALGDLSRADHLQGVQRLAIAGQDVLVLSRSTGSASEADVGVATLESSAGGGGPLGSNRDSDRYPVAATAPPPGDRIAAAFDDGSGHTHAGGGQVMGQIYAVPLERGRGGSLVQLRDLADPLAPRLIGSVPGIAPSGAPRDDAGTASLAALADGRFLLVIGGHDAARLDLFLSTTTEIEATGWRHLVTWWAIEARTALDEGHVGAYQGLQLVAAADGRLYLAGTHKNWTGDDWLDLFRLEAVDDDAPRATLTKVARRRFGCSIEGIRHCDFDAAAGIYVGPDRRLALYATEHDNDGPRFDGDPAPGGVDGSIKMMEFY
jgi:hypothetical protein